MPNTCATQGSQRCLRWSRHCGGGSAKPSADPTLIRNRHLPLGWLGGSRRDQDPPRPWQRRGLKALGRARTAGSGCPQPAGQSSSAAYRTAGTRAGRRRLVGHTLRATDGLRRFVCLASVRRRVCMAAKDGAALLVLPASRTPSVRWGLARTSSHARSGDLPAVRLGKIKPGRRGTQRR